MIKAEKEDNRKRAFWNAFFAIVFFTYINYVQTAVTSLSDKTFHDNQLFCKNATLDVRGTQ